MGLWKLVLCDILYTVKTLSSLSLGIAAWVYAVPCYAQLIGTVPDLGTTATVADVRTGLVNILDTILSYLAILAVLFIVIAGVRLIVAGGDDTQREKARKSIIFVLVGLLVILFAKALISFVVNNVGTN